MPTITYNGWFWLNLSGSKWLELINGWVIDPPKMLLAMDWTEMGQNAGIQPIQFLLSFNALFVL